MVDGDRLMLATAPGTLADVTTDDVLAERVLPAALLVRTLDTPRRQRVGAQQIAAMALAELPFYALREGIDADALPLVEAAASPYDRLIVAPGAPPPASPERLARVAANGGDTAALLEAVFADLASSAPAGSTRHAQKWAFGDIKRELGARLARRAHAAAAANRTLRLLHWRCGDAGLSLAVDPALTYIGVDDRADERTRARASHEGLAIHAPDQLSPGEIGEVGIYLLTDAPTSGDAAAGAGALARLAALAARRVVVITIAPCPVGQDLHGLTNAAWVSNLASVLGTAFGGTCVTRLVTSLAHKPLDVLPSTVIAEFEVSR